jgi:hypothetical protein
MNEDQLRALVRESVQRHLGGNPGDPQIPAPGRPHASHSRFEVQVGADMGGPCLIEPAVSCNHCGYCQSYGH